MARIDARFGRTPGVNPVTLTPTSEGAFGALQDVGRGVQIVGGALEQRREQHALAARRREAEEDQIAVADLKGRSQIEWSKHLDARSDAYDGATGGFAGNIETELDEFLNDAIAQEPQRRQGAARLALTGVKQSLALSAYDIEDAKRESHTLSAAGRGIETDINAVRVDPAYLPTALENFDARKAALAPGLATEVEKARPSIYAAYGEARIDADPDDYLRELQSGDLKSQLPPALFSRHVDAANRAIETRQREAANRAERARKAANATLDNEMDAIEAAIDAGLPVSEGRFENLAGVAAQADEPQRARYEQRRAIIRAVEALHDTPLVEAERLIADERQRLHGKGDASGFEADRVSALEKALSGMETRISDDLVGFVQDVRPDDMAPLDFTDLKADDLMRRANEADAAAAFYGVDAQYFSDIERQQIARAFFDDPRGAIGFAAQIAGHPRGRNMLAEIAPKEPQLAHLGGLLAAGGDGQFIDDAAKGAELIKADGFKTALAEGNGGATDLAQTTLAPAFALFPQSAEAAIASARLAYEARARRAGKTKEDFATNQKMYARVLQEAAGGVYQHNGRLTGGVQEYSANGYSMQAIVPSWMENGRLEKWVKGLRAADLDGARAFDGDGNEIALRVLRKAIPVAAGDGVYQMALGDPAYDPQWAVDEAGDPFLLDLNEIRDRRSKGPKPAGASNIPRGF